MGYAGSALKFCDLYESVISMTKVVFPGHEMGVER